MRSPECQLHCLPRIHEPLTALDRIMQFPNRIQRFVKRRINFWSNKLSVNVSPAKMPDSQSSLMPVARAERLEPGDMVRIRSRSEIRATLDHWNNLKGCTFLEEMWPYCSTTQRVYKKVEQFLDEQDYLVKKCHRIVILEGVFCHGTVDFGKCDRTCFFFWREEWLEKI